MTVDKNFNQFVDMPTGKTVGAIVLFSSEINLALKVDRAALLILCSTKQVKF